MNANDANTVKFLVVQWQNHVILDRQTDYLLPVKMSSRAAQNVVCPRGIKAMPERRWSVHALVIFQVRHFSPLLCGPSFSSPAFSAPPQTYR